MIETNRVTRQNTELKKLDKQHEELRIQEQRVKLNLKDNEEKQVEINRRMNRPGQNVDKMA